MYAVYSIASHCKNLCTELRRLACAVANKTIGQDDFIKELLRIESEKVRPYGMTLVACETLDHWTHIDLYANYKHEICGSVEFQLETGAFR